MAIKKIPCGGFYYNDETVNFDDDVMTVIGGGNVPAPEVADIGKVLGIVEDGTGAKYAPVEGSGSGLPDPSTLTDGTALVAVNGEWKTQEGYGYTGDPAFEPITWDGSTEGRESINEGTFFKVAEELDITALDGSVATLSGAESGELMFVSTEEVMPNYYIAFYDNEDTAIIILTDDVDVGEGIIFRKGVYFPNRSELYISALTAPSISHPINHTLMPRGYGYYGEPAFEPITWDGNTEGKTLLFDEYCKVSEDVMPVDALVGSEVVAFVEGERLDGSYLRGLAVSDDVFQAVYSSGSTIIVVANNTEFDGEEIEKGVYFAFNEDSYVASLTASPSVHKFDPALIPSSGGAYTVTFSSDDGENFTCDKALNEIFANSNNAKFVLQLG